MIYNAKLIILYKEYKELNSLIIERLLQYENIEVKTIKVNKKSDYYNLHGTRIDGLYISNKLYGIISEDDILDVLEPMLNVSIFNSRIRWVGED